MKKFILPLLFMLLLNITSIFSFSANFKDLPTSIKQPDGSTIQCFASGDEFFNYLHDANGYTIIQGQDGWYYYAKKDLSGKIVPSTYKAGTVNPSSVNLVPYIKISEAEYKVKSKKYLDPINNPALGAPANSKAPATGSFSNIVVYIRFADDPAFSNDRQTYIDLFTGTGGATYSVQEYFTSVSYNQLTVGAEHFPICAPTTNLSFQDSHNRGYFQPYNASTNPGGYQDDTESRLREHQLLADAVNYVKTEVEANMTAGEVDQDSDGYVDNMSFIIYGNNDTWSDLLWAHRWALYSNTVYINGKRVWDYNLQPETQCTSHTTCHELFHCIGSPDLYHYTDNGVNPCWYWDLMEYGSGSMTAYMKEQIGGWITIPEITTSGSYTLSPLAGSTNNAYKIALPNSTTEFLVLEFRKKTGPVEVKLPSSADEGLLIYRVNTSVSINDGNRNGPPDMLWVYRPNGDTNNNGTPGDATFSSTQGRTSFGSSSNPACLLSDDATWGGVSITNVGAVGSTISFDVTLPSSGYNVTFNVTDGTTPVATADVTFNGSTQQTNASGSTIFTGVATGNNLAYSVVKTGYTTVNSTVNVVNQDVTENVILVSQTATNLAVQGTPTANSAILTWSGSGATNYQIQYYIQGTTSYFFQTATSSPFTLQALEPNSTYCCRIRTNLNGTYTSYSSIVNFTTANGSSILATNLALQGSPTANTATLTWSGSGADAYQIQYYINGTTNYFFQSTTSSPFTLNALQPNTSYNCRIRTYSGGIYTSYSSILTFTTANGSSILATNLAVQGTPASTTCTLTWDGSGATSYQILYYKAGTTVYKILTCTSSPATLKSLLPGTTYNCRIRTYSGGMYTSYSPVLTFTTSAFAKNTIATEPAIFEPITDANIYPNPATSFYNLDFNSETEGQINLSIYNIDGRLCETRIIEYSSGINHFVFDTQKLAKGVYLVIFNKDTFTSHLKLIIQ